MSKKLKEKYRAVKRLILLSYIIPHADSWAMQEVESGYDWRWPVLMFNRRNR